MMILNEITTQKIEKYLIDLYLTQCLFEINTPPNNRNLKVKFNRYIARAHDGTSSGRVQESIEHVKNNRYNIV